MSHATQVAGQQHASERPPAEHSLAEHPPAEHPPAEHLPAEHPAQQLTLSFARPAEILAAVVPRDASLAERFEAFRLQNPHVESAIVAIARDWRRRGMRRTGMKMIFEHLRWRWAMHTHGDKYRLNNSFTSLYARRVMHRYPDLADFFETRERQK